MTCYSRCPQITKDFYDDFDMLPTEYKRMLDEGSATPTLADVRAAWEMVLHDTNYSSLAGLMDKLKCMEKTEAEKKAERIKKAKEKREQRLRDRKKPKHRNYVEQRPIYGAPVRRKDDNLIRRLITEEEAAELLARRKRANEIKFAYTHYRPIIGYREVKVEVKDADQYLPPEKQVKITLPKIMHNAGGKT